MVEKFKILSAGRDSKGLNIFKSSAYKEHEQTPMAQVFWALRWSVGVWLVCALTFCFSFIFEHIWRYGWSDATLDWIKIYLHNMMTSGGMSVIAEIPYWILRCVMHPDYACIVNEYLMEIPGCFSNNSLMLFLIISSRFSSFFLQKSRKIMEISTLSELPDTSLICQ